MFAPSRFGSLHVHKFPHNLKSGFMCVFAHEFLLRGNRISLAFLIFAGDTSVNDGWFHLFSRSGEFPAIFVQHTLQFLDFFVNGANGIFQILIAKKSVPAFHRVAFSGA
jgi:hypothetical protein